MSPGGNVLAALDDDGRALWSRAAALVARGVHASLDPGERDALAIELFAWQRRRCAAIDRVARAFERAVPARTVDDLPGVPTDAWKASRIACFDTEFATREFRTSGTTNDVRGTHAFADTSLYASAAVASAARWLLRSEHYTLMLLAHDEAEAPDSSLSFMLGRFVERWHRPREVTPWRISGDAVDVAGIRASARAACERGEPVGLLGATWGFVHLDDALGADERFVLPPGSVVMPTGGFKGRSREIAPRELFELIERRWGVSRAQIVQEYGMTELSSQAYECHDGECPAGRYLSPPWMYARAVDPDTLEVLPDGSVGLLKIVDLLNVGSCAVVQTSDIGVVHPVGFEVLGRAQGATPRGCARALDAALSLDRARR